MTFQAHHLPGPNDPHDLLFLDGGPARAGVPRLTANDLHAICRALRAARAQLAEMPVARIIAAIDAAAHRLRDPAADGFDDLIAGIAAFTGYSVPMVRHVLERMSADWLAGPLEQLVEAELGGPAAVDGFRESVGGVRSRAVAHPLTFHVFAGNVPGVSVTSMVRALLVKSAVLGKTAAGEPLLAPHFARLLARADPPIAAAVAVTYWSGGDSALEQVALEHADAVIHYGGAEAIASLRARAPAGLPFLDHGPRVSCAILAGDRLAGEAGNRAAHDLARAVALFDQQGCVSPQVAYIVGGDDSTARHFGARVARELDALQQELPRGRIDAGTATAVRDLRTRAEFRAIAGERVELWGGESLTWTVVLDPDPAFAGTCLNRTLILKTASSVERVIDLIRPSARLLQTVGVAGFAGDRLLQLAAAAADAGATRVSSLARMPWPPPAWHHDGRGPLTELVRWVDLED